MNWVYFGALSMNTCEVDLSVLWGMQRDGANGKSTEFKDTICTDFSKSWVCTTLCISSKNLHSTQHVWIGHCLIVCHALHL